MSRRVLITGSRHWIDEESIRELIDSLPDDTTVMFGDCPTGADHIAALLCAKRRLWTEVYYADWATHGKKAGPLRNQDMVDAKPTEAHAFPLPDSRGTWDCVRRCEAAGIPVTITTATRCPQCQKYHPAPKGMTRKLCASCATRAGSGR